MNIRQKKFLEGNAGGGSNTVSEEIMERARIAARIEDLESNKAFRATNITPLDFVESDIVNSLFENAATDVEQLSDSMNKYGADIIAASDSIKSKYKLVENAYYGVASKVTWLNLVSGFVDKNMKVVLESFDSDADIIENTLNLNTTEGKLFLPVKSKKEISTAGISLRVLPQSNGYFESDKELAAAFDGDPISFCEYKQGVSSDNLTLAFVARLNSPETFNQISISPNNFGSENWLKLTDVMVSGDGANFRSVYDATVFYNNQTYMLNDARVIELKGSSKEFILEFQPVRAQFVKFVFRQDTLHPVHDDYRIGINSISFSRVLYSGSGSIVFRKPLLSPTVQDVTLHTEQISHVDSQFLVTEYFVSFDEKDWYRIAPASSLSDIPKVLSFNQPWNSRSISLPKFGAYIYVKINMRYDAAKIMQSYSEMSYESSETLKLAQALELKNAPTKDSLTLYVPSFSTADGKVVIGKTTNSRTYSIRTPFIPSAEDELMIDGVVVPRKNKKEEIMHSFGYYFEPTTSAVYIHVPKKDYQPKPYTDPWLTPPPSASGAAGSAVGDDALDTDLSQISNSITGKDIYFVLKPDVFDASVSGVFTLKYMSDNKKENFKVTRIKKSDVGVSHPQVKDVVKSGETKIKLTHLPLKGKQHPVVLASGTAYEVPFVDGIAEFFGAMDDFAFSVDYESGWLYLKQPFAMSVSVSYYRSKRYTLNQNDFYLAKNGRELIIQPWAFDQDSLYSASYQIAAVIPEKMYKIKEKQLVMDVANIKKLFGNSISERDIVASYQYKEDIRAVVAELSEMLSPIVNQVSIIYSV